VSIPLRERPEQEPVDPETPGEAVAEGVQPADASEPATVGRRAGVQRGPLRRYTKGAILLVSALVAAALVSVVTIDLGPSLRARAEQAMSTQFTRPVHIGRLGTFLLPGQFVIEDMVIEGLEPGAPPFFTGERIFVSMSWPALLRGEILIDSVDMRNWRMRVQQFGDGRHNFPRFTRGGDQSREADAEGRRIVTTLRYLRAHDGEFVYEDQGAPWSIVAPHVDLTITKVLDYGGHVSFSDGTVQIGSFRPMRADMSSTFELDGGKVTLTAIDLHTDGAESELSGSVDVGNWPEMVYNVRSRVDFPRMREIFFADDDFTLAGDGTFTGTWHLYKGGRRLEGTFDSKLARFNALDFSDLRGALVWEAHRFEVTEATSGFYGGAAHLQYAMAPLGEDEPGVARFDARYEDVDLESLFAALGIEPIRPAGRATGRNGLEWRIGDFADRRGAGQVTVEPPPGVRLQIRARAEDGAASLAEAAGMASTPGAERFGVGGELTYAFGPEWIDISPSRLATAATYLEFSGRTAYGERAEIPFHVTSADWQESDRLMASVLTTFGVPTRPISVGGRGGLDGVMRGAFTAPRIEGRFVGDDIRAWNVTWGSGRGEIVVENSYLDVRRGRFDSRSASVDIDGRFSLGYPRTDRGEEINATFRLASLPSASLRAAFGLRGYHVDGPLTGDVHLYGQYRRPFGFGRVRIDAPVAYGEMFDWASAGLRFEGNGVRIDGLDVQKGPGRITGAAFIGWDGLYSFNADGRRIAMETVASLAQPRVPLTGTLQFMASGVGTFESPRYEVRGSIADLVVRDEGIGQVTGRIDVRNQVLALELEAGSPRLAVSGSGRIALTPEADAELLLRFTNTSLDPYVRTFEPRLSPFTTAVVSGSLRAVGALRNLDRLRVEGTVDHLDLRLFDYPVRNDGPIRLALEEQAVRIDRMRLTGEGTALNLTGEVDLHNEAIAVQAKGDANLGILQGFLGDIRSAGDAELVAEIRGSVREPVLVGEATISRGRLRHFSLPHAFEAIDGRLVFEPGGVRFDELAAELGGGRVRFGGRIGLRGIELTELGVTATGERMQVRYPEGFRSIVDADLTLRGDVREPLLAGTVQVRDAVWVEPLQGGGGLFDLASRDRSLEPRPPAEPTVPLRFDVRIEAPSSLRLDDNTARVVSSAELTVRGTYDAPLLFGTAEIERGEVFFEGNRYRVTRGTIGFANPTRIEPFFDIEAETDVRVPGQTYRVTFRMTGTLDRWVPELTSDPPLSQVDILALLLGDIRDPQEAELRALRAPEAAQQQLVQAGAARLLTSTLSSGVGRVVERSFGVDTFEITPALADPSAQQSAQLNPTARLLIGKRISTRAHLTLSRALTGSDRDLIVVLEYDQSDRLSWVISQNEDRTYALDFRVRHAF